MRILFRKIRIPGNFSYHSKQILSRKINCTAAKSALIVPHSLNFHSIDQDDGKSKSSGSPGSSSSSSLGRKKWVVNGVNSKVEPLNQYHGVYKAKEFDSPEIIDEEDTTETDDKSTHPDFKPVPFYSLVGFVRLI